MPTESEWEYAARAGTRGSRYGELDAIAWWSGNYGVQTHPVKQKAPNAWGLYDMIGNVAEWCSDRYGEYPTGSVTNPTGPSSGYPRVIRGSSCNDGHWYSRSAFRTKREPGFRSTIGLGFRPALSSVRLAQSRAGGGWSGAAAEPELGASAASGHLEGVEVLTAQDAGSRRLGCLLPRYSSLHGVASSAVTAATGL